MKKNRGSIIVESTLIYGIVFILILIAYLTSISIVKTEAEMTSDDVISSELAVYKDINFDLLARSNDLKLLVITDKETALKTFQIYLQENLNLKEDFKPKSENYNFIKSRVNIESFIIYNVYENGIEIFKYEEKFNSEKKEMIGVWDKEQERKAKGTVITPKGNTVEHTTIYAKIGFTINPIFKSKNYVTVEEESDILKE
ncbi:hypothetical protein [Clostridium sp. HBUAS56017]|uniref:hypothetical protein n=1 Tax=Clostridium sp. HBUAS56017 TaxID=2571128 RepID=UPI0011776854|nr:hypothetical protein [Clostridium sp. HBUAS56017]